MPRSSKASARKRCGKGTINKQNCAVCGESEIRAKIPFDVDTFVPPVWCDGSMGHCGRWVHGTCGNFSSAEEIESTAFYLCPFCRIADEADEFVPLKDVAAPTIQHSAPDTVFQGDFGLPPPLPINTGSLCTVEEPEIEDALTLTVPSSIDAQLDANTSNMDQPEKIPFEDVIVCTAFSGLSDIVVVEENSRLPLFPTKTADCSYISVCEPEEPMREEDEERDVTTAADAIHPNVSELKITSANGNQTETVPCEASAALASQPGSSNTSVTLNDRNSGWPKSTNVAVCSEFQEECGQSFSVPISSSALHNDSFIYADEPMLDLQSSPVLDISSADALEVEKCILDGTQTASVPPEAELQVPTDEQPTGAQNPGLSSTAESLGLSTIQSSADSLHDEGDELMPEIEVGCPFGNPNPETSEMDKSSSDNSVTETLKTAVPSPRQPHAANHDRRYSREEIEEAIGVLSSDSSDSENSDDEDESSSGAKKLCVRTEDDKMDGVDGVVSEITATEFDLPGLNGSTLSVISVEGKNDESVVTSTSLSQVVARLTYGDSCTPAPASPTCDSTNIRDPLSGETELQLDSKMLYTSSVGCLNDGQAFRSADVGDANGKKEIIFDKFVPSTSSVSMGSGAFEDDKALILISSDLVYGDNDDETFTYENIAAQSPGLVQWYLDRCPELPREALEGQIRHNVKLLEEVRFIQRAYASDWAI